MIPKVIHYCWFGRSEKNSSVLKCIESWKKFCPDYEIVRCDESNFDVNENDYCREAYWCVGVLILIPAERISKLMNWIFWDL